MSTSELPSIANLRPDFIWGVFTSSFQIEGAAKEKTVEDRVSGIAWPRVLPGRGSANEPGLAFYDRLIDELWPPASNRGYACIIGICRRLSRIAATGK
jgi:beta-glucosidase